MRGVKALRFLEKIIFGESQERNTMFKIKKCYTQEVTESLIYRFAHMIPLDKERDLKQIRVERLHERIEAGLILPFQWMSIWIDDCEYRLNGQHSSATLLEMSNNGNLPSPIYAQVTEFEASNSEDAAEIWSQIDAVWNARSACDIYKMTGATCPELAEVPSRVLEMCATGIALEHYNSFSKTYSSTAHDRAKLLVVNAKFILAFSELVSEAEKAKHIRRGPVVAGFLRCYKKFIEESINFMYNVKDEDDPNPKSASRILAKKLCEHSVSGLGGANGKKTASPPDMAAWVIRAFNAYKKNETDIVLKGLIGKKTTLPEVE